MDYSPCANAHCRNNFSRFCIQSKCNLQRKVCGACEKEHTKFNHSVISFEDKQNFYINFDRQHIQSILNNRRQRVRQVSDKMIEQFKNLLKKIQTMYDQLNMPMNMLLLIKTQEQADNKRHQIKNETDKDKLAKLAAQVRCIEFLKQNPHCLRKNYLQDVTEIQNAQLLKLRESLEKHLQQISISIDRMKSLSLISINIETELQKRRNQINEENTRQKSQRRETFTNNAQQERQKFLKQFNKNIIGTKSSIPVAEWKRNKKFEQIEELDLQNMNLQSIPVQINLFPNLKELNLAFNKIKKIQNLENLTKLKKLLLSHNQIKSTENLQMLTNLERLFLEDNKIVQIGNLYHLKFLKKLNIESNPLNKTEYALIKRMENKGVAINK